MQKMLYSTAETGWEGARSRRDKKNNVFHGYIYYLNESMDGECGKVCVCVCVA